MRILIVEDDLVNREFLLLALEPHGQCIVAENGEDAVDVATKALDDRQPFELMMLDILLPGMDGLQALETIRAHEQRQGISTEAMCKVIVTTALDDDANAGRAFAQGQAMSYLTKPFTMERITEELQKLELI